MSLRRRAILCATSQVWLLSVALAMPAMDPDVKGALGRMSRVAPDFCASYAPLYGATATRDVIGRTKEAVSYATVTSQSTTTVVQTTTAPTPLSSVTVDSTAATTTLTFYTLNTESVTATAFSTTVTTPIATTTATLTDRETITTTTTQTIFDSPTTTVLTLSSATTTATTAATTTATTTNLGRLARREGSVPPIFSDFSPAVLSSACALYLADTTTTVLRPTSTRIAFLSQSTVTTASTITATESTAVTPALVIETATRSHTLTQAQTETLLTTESTAATSVTVTSTASTSTETQLATITEVSTTLLTLPTHVPVVATCYYIATLGTSTCNPIGYLMFSFAGRLKSSLFIPDNNRGGQDILAYDLYASQGGALAVLVGDRIFLTELNACLTNQYYTNVGPNPYYYAFAAPCSDTNELQTGFTQNSDMSINSPFGSLAVTGFDGQFYVTWTTATNQHNYYLLLSPV